MQAGLRHAGYVLRPSIHLKARSESSATIGFCIRSIFSNGVHYKHTTSHHFSTSSRLRTDIASPNILPSKSEQHVLQDSYVYHGPLTTPFRNLKTFSVASIGLSITLSPLLFVIESNLPLTARFALAGIALGTSGLSTALVSWCAKPYVTKMRRFRPDTSGSAEEIELTTQTLFLRPRVTKVYDPSFLIETRRPLAKWELADKIHLTENRREAVGTNVHPEKGLEETVAETSNEQGEIIGRWVVKWEGDGVGTCREMGTVVRYFNVHEEMLQ